MNLDDLLGDGILDFLTSSENPSGEVNIDQLFDDAYGAYEELSTTSTHLGAGNVGQGSCASAVTGLLQPHPPQLAS